MITKATIIKKLPVVCVALGLLGVPATAFLSGRATVKAKTELEVWGDILAEDNKPQNTWDEVKLTWKCYIPPVVVGALTMACILVSYKLNRKEIAALSASAAFLAHKGEKLEEKVMEHYGKDALEAMRMEIAEDMYNPVSVEETGNGDILCLDSFSGRWFRSSIEAVRKAQDEFNAEYATDQYLSLNDLYRRYGIQETFFGYQYGWPAKSSEYYDGPITFENHILASGEFHDIPEEVIIIEFAYGEYPMECWMEV